MTDPQWLSDDEQRMWRAFQVMNRHVDQAVERDLMTSGLSMADFAVLVQLSEAPQRRLRARDLGLQLDWDRSRLSHQIRRMEQRGIVIRSNCPTDARGTFVQLTQDGWELIEKAAPSHVAAVRAAFFDALSPHDVETLHAIATRISARLSAPADDAEAGGSRPVC